MMTPMSQNKYHFFYSETNIDFTIKQLYWRHYPSYLIPENTVGLLLLRFQNQVITEKEVRLTNSIMP